MASSLVQRNKVVAKRKGTLAAATAAGAGVIALVAGSPVIAVLGVAGAAYLTWDWFSFRVKNGMRF
jgi:threonine/homoserine/homoserine lactone efflux protein